MRTINEINNTMIVYKIVNSLNQKVYIGITSKTVELRFDWHCRDCSQGRRKKLYTAMREFGTENFKIEMLEECEKADAKIREEFYINLYDSYHNGYNGSQKSCGVKEHTAETRKKMSESAKGRIVSAETKTKKSQKMKDIWRNATDEKRKQYSEMSKVRNSGKIRTDKQKSYQSAVMTGKKHSKETIEKMKQTRKGKLLSAIISPVECPHCGKIGKSNAMLRWHFDKCKDKQ